MQSTTPPTRRALRHYLLALKSDIGVKGIVPDDDAGGSLMQSERVK